MSIEHPRLSCCGQRWTAATSELCRDSKFHLERGRRSLTTAEWWTTGWRSLNAIGNLARGWPGHRRLGRLAVAPTAARGRFQLAVDDLLVTNIERRRKAIDMRAANLFLVKLNQIGSLTLAPLASEKTYALQAPLVVRSEASLIDH